MIHLLLLLALPCYSQNSSLPQYSLTGSDYKSESSAINQMLINNSLETQKLQKQISAISYPSVNTSTRQVLTSGSGATYSTPANVRQLRIRMVAAGGGGGSMSTAGADGSSGTFTIFGSTMVIGGAGGCGVGTCLSFGAGGYTGPPTSILYRAPGGSGGPNVYNGAAGRGGDSLLGGGAQSIYSSPGANGTDAHANSGGGGSGSPYEPNWSGGGGGAGEYAEWIINNPAASYSYTIGTGGTGGAGSGYVGGAGGSGSIIVEEMY